MKKTLMIVSMVLAQLAFAGAKEEFKLIHTQDLVALMKQKDAKLAIFDANNAKTRKKEGVIPGATLLSSYKEYDLKTVLPADKDSTLVFYCANTKCMASHEAAERAVHEGYTNVNVMADGIQGWKKAGQKADKPAL